MCVDITLVYVIIVNYTYEKASVKGEILLI